MRRSAAHRTTRRLRRTCANEYSSSEALIEDDGDVRYVGDSPNAGTAIFVSIGGSRKSSAAPSSMHVAQGSIAIVSRPRGRPRASKTSH